MMFVFTPLLSTLGETVIRVNALSCSAASRFSFAYSSRKASMLRA